MSARQGFALLAVLWIVVAASSLAIATHAVARQALDGASNRTELLKARWIAADCLERARATIAHVLAYRDNLQAGITSSPFSSSHYSWRSVGEAVRASRLLPVDGCELTVSAAGSRASVNAADEELLRALFRVAKVPEKRVDSLVDALLDWRDADDVPRTVGAERAWYAGAQRQLPRNASVADRRELRLVRGFESPASIDSLFDVEPGRIALEHAPVRVLLALPGFGHETVGRIMELRARGQAIPDLIVLGESVSPAAREEMLARYADLVRLTTFEPDAWIVTARGRAGPKPVTYALELRLVRAGDRAAIVRRRSWVE
jgi:type II secretory pathway component PulK